eukprot:scaffold10.g2321.t1
MHGARCARPHLCSGCCSTAPVEGVIAGHQKLVSRSKVQHALAVSAIATAAAAAAGQRESHAAAPLALVAGLGTLAVAYSLLVMKPASRKIEASPLAPAAADAAKSSPKNCKDREQEEAKARDQLATFARMYSIRTGLALLSFGSAICGVLLLDKKKH